MHGGAKLCWCASVDTAPWIATPERRAATEAKLQQLKLPTAWGSNIKYIVSRPGYLTCADWIRLAGPLGIWLLRQLLQPSATRDAMCGMISALHLLRASSFTRADMPRLSQTVWQAVVKLECYLPVHLFTTTPHLVGEVLLGGIDKHGPLNEYWL